MRGGKPGAFPSFKSGGLPHPVPFDLYDPLGFSKKMAPEKKEKRVPPAPRSLPTLTIPHTAQLASFGYPCFALSPP